MPATLEKTFESLKVFDPETSLVQLAADHRMTVDKLFAQVVAWATQKGVLKQVGATILAQYWLEARRQSVAADRNEYVAWAMQQLGLDNAEATAAIAAAEACIPESAGTLDIAGYKLAQVFAAYKVPLEFLPPAVEALRHYGFIFKMKAGTSFSAVEARLPEVLSFSGFDPKRMAYLEPRIGGKMAVFVPKEASQATDYPLLRHYASGVKPEEPGLIGICAAIIKSHGGNHSINRPVEIPVGISIFNETVTVPLGKGAMIVGQPRSGKTVVQEVLLSTMQLLWTPKQLQIVLIDMKAVFAAQYKDSPHLIFPAIDDESLEEEFPRLKRALTHELKRRKDAFKAASVKTIYEFNDYQARQGDANLMPIIYVFVDEIKDAIDQEKDFENWIWLGTRRYTAFGVFFILATQYAPDIPPKIRGNIGTQVGLRLPKSTSAELVFANPALARWLPDLLGAGDCIIQGDTEKLIGGVRTQVFNLPLDHCKAALTALQKAYEPSELLYIPPDPREDEETGEGEVSAAMQCPTCGNNHIVKHGFVNKGGVRTPRFRCGGEPAHVFTNPS
jgi:hypothetical protein